MDDDIIVIIIILFDGLLFLFSLSLVQNEDDYLKGIWGCLYASSNVL